MASGYHDLLAFLFGWKSAAAVGTGPWRASRLHVHVAGETQQHVFQAGDRLAHVHTAGDTLQFVSDDGGGRG